LTKPVLADSLTRVDMLLVLLLAFLGAVEERRTAA
jgi:hypothetical protein